MIISEPVALPSVQGALLDKSNKHPKQKRRKRKKNTSEYHLGFTDKYIALLLTQRVETSG